MRLAFLTVLGVLLVGAGPFRTPIPLSEVLSQTTLIVILVSVFVLAVVMLYVSALEESRLARVKTRFDIFKGLVEVAAIVLAGWWAYDKFFKTEAPSIGRRIRMESELIWTDKTPSLCLAEVKVKVTNIGKADLEVKSARLQAWRVPAAAWQAGAPAGAVRLIDLKDFKQDETKVLERPIKAFVARYGPDVEWKETLVLVVPRLPQDIVLLYLELGFNPKVPEDIDWIHEWGWVCGDPPNSAAPPSRRRMNPRQQQREQEQQRR
jgi:hypothetical protein